MVTYRGFSRVVPMKYLVFPCFPYFFACFEASVFRERWSSSAGTWTRTNCRSAWIVAPCYQTPSEEKNEKRAKTAGRWDEMMKNYEIWWSLKMLFGDVETIRLYGFCFGPESRHVRYSLVQSVNVETIDDKTLHFLNFGLSFFRKSKWPAAPAMAKVAGDGRCWNAWYVHLDSWHFNRGAAASSNFDQFGHFGDVSNLSMKLCKCDSTATSTYIH